MSQHKVEVRPAAGPPAPNDGGVRKSDGSDRSDGRGSWGGRTARKEFGEAVAALRPALLNACRKQVENEDHAQDITSQTILVALEKASAFDRELGPDALLNWLLGIQSLELAMHFRRRQRELAPEDMNGIEDPDTRRSVLSGEEERDRLGHMERAAAARVRLRHAGLSGKEANCLLGRLRGETVEETAERLDVCGRTVLRHLRQAERKLRSAALDQLAEAAMPEVDDYLFRFCSQVTVYRPPMKTGAALARERLRKMK